MFSLLNIQIQHVLSDASDATCRNLLPIPLRLWPHKHLHSQVTEYCPILVSMSIYMCLMGASPQHGDVGTQLPLDLKPPAQCQPPYLQLQIANSSAIESGVPEERTGSSFTLIIGKSAEQRFLYTILFRNTRLF